MVKITLVSLATITLRIEVALFPIAPDVFKGTVILFARASFKVPAYFTSLHEFFYYANPG